MECSQVWKTGEAGAQYPFTSYTSNVSLALEQSAVKALDTHSLDSFGVISENIT